MSSFKIGLLSLISLCFSASANPLPEWPFDWPQNKGALRAVGPNTPNIISSLDFPSDLLETSLLIRNAVDGQSCSANVVSDDGHVLTAYHCLAACLNRAGWFESEPMKAQGRLGNSYDVRYRYQARKDSIDCRLTLTYVSGAGIRNFQVIGKVVAGPKCWAETIRNGKAEVSKDFDGDVLPESLNLDPSYYNNCDRSQDVAVFQVDPNFLSERLCASLAPASPNINTPVLNIGFPTSTARGYGDSNGAGLFFSTGTILSQSYCRMEYKDGAVLHSNFPFTFGKMLLQTSIDVVPRSSGSALFNKAGEVVGVASAIYRPLQDERSHCRGASMFSNVQHLKSFNLNLKCEKQKINGSNL